MSLCKFPNLSILQSQLKHRDYAISHELRSDRTADQGWKLMAAKCYILLDLDNAQFI